MRELKWIVTNQNREPLDTALDARILIPAAVQGRDGLDLAERANVVVVAYYEPSSTDPCRSSGLVSLADSLYSCEKRDREEDWILIGRVGGVVERLHRVAHQRFRNYAQALANWQAYRLFAGALAAQLPMGWQTIGCDNPTQNHTGSTNGANHVVLDAPIAFGRMLREKGDALCKPWAKFNGNLHVQADVPTCKQCLLVAERIVHTRVRHLMDGSFEHSADHFMRAE